MFGKILFILMQCSVAVLSFTKPERPCKMSDIKCQTNIGQELYLEAILGNQELGVEPLDPMHQELVDGGIPSLNYSFTNSTVIGLKDAIINEAKFVPPESLLFDVTFPRYEMAGNYQVDGTFMNLPVEGKGKFYVNATNIHMKIDATRKVYEKDGKKYIKLTAIKTNSELLGTMYLDLENLFNGNKALAEPVLKFMNDHPKVTADMWQNPIGTANMKKIFKNGNKLFANIPIDDIFEKQ